MGSSLLEGVYRMEMAFQKTEAPCLLAAVREVQNSEQTQELRLPDLWIAGMTASVCVSDWHLKYQPQK